MLRRRDQTVRSLRVEHYSSAALETDAPDVTGQSVGVLADQGDGIRAIGFVNANGSHGADAVRLEEHHDLSNGLLIGPARGDARDALRADTPQFLQSVGFVLDDVEDVLAEFPHQLPGEMRPDALDHAAAQVFLDTVDRTGWHHLQKARLELDAVITMVVPAAAGLDKLTRLDGSRRAQDGDEVTVTTHLHPEDAESRLLAVAGHAFDQPGERLTVVGWARGHAM